MKNIPSFHSKITGAIRGGAIGDALGLPYEKLTAQEISTNFSDEKSYGAIGNHGRIKEGIKQGFVPFVGDETGVISDDTIFTMAGMQSISEKKKIDIQHLFDAHKVFFDKYGSTFFGGETAKKFTNYTLGGDVTQLHNTSRANGALMKQFPYAAYFYKWVQTNENMLLSPTEQGKYMDETLLTIISVTHDTAIAKLAGILHNKTLLYLLDKTPETYNSQELLSYLYMIAPIREKMLGIDEKAKNYDPDSDMRISPIIAKLLIQQQAIQHGHLYSYDQIIDTYIVSLDERKAPGINQTMKPGFHVASTFGLVYACFIQQQNFQGLLDAIRIGYDTDTQGAIIGNMIGALRGPFYEQSYITGLQEKDAIQKHIETFSETVAI